LKNKKYHNVGTDVMISIIITLLNNIQDNSSPYLNNY